MLNLVKHLNEPETVIFVGSGVSRWSGLPSWEGMIAELIDFLEAAGKSADLVRDEHKNGELLQAASYGFDQLTQQQIGEFIRQSCRYGTAKPDDIHRKIVELGPTSFVTTNYDNLLEEALRTFKQSTFFPPPVTNRHLTEMATLAQSKKSGFVFKPHGDASDAQSIVLTREQYRKLLPQGEWNRALETLKTLMISRPVLYVGFGLRDPDFIYLRDLLANTYEGAVRDHYAILPNMTEEEINYWRRSYGIHILNYKTTTDDQGKVSHEGLLVALDQLKEQPVKKVIEEEQEAENAEFELALLRHASRLARVKSSNDKIPIGVEKQSKQERKFSRKYWRNSFRNVDELLVYGPQRTLLVGLPGAGKTHSLNFAAAELSKQLQEASMGAEADIKEVAIPVVVDMKQYDGDLWSLADNTLPVGISLEQLISHFKVKIFVDSFNEMPKKYWTDAKYEDDLGKFIKRVENASLVFASRTSYGIPEHDFEVYTLSSIDGKLAEKALLDKGFLLDGDFRREMVDLISRPFFYRLLQDNKIDVGSSANPRSVFVRMFEGLSERFRERFQNSLDLTTILERIAFDTMNAGTEYFNFTSLEAITLGELEGSESDASAAEEIINWLISQEVLQPLPKRRLAFFHQSVTEFLAASHLASVYEQDPSVLKEVLRFRRWDQALMQITALLPEEKSDQLLDEILNLDQRLALSSCKYLEENRDQVILSVLEKCIESHDAGSSEDLELGWAIETDLPLNSHHIPVLRQFVEKRGSLGGSAALRLAMIRGSDEKPMLLELLLEGERDYNFLANGVGKALSKLVTNDDLVVIANWVAENSNQTNDVEATTTSIAYALSELPEKDVLDCLAPSLKKGTVSSLAAGILCDIGYEKKTQAWLDIYFRLLPIETHDACVAIHFILWRGNSLSLDGIKGKELDCIIQSISDGDGFALLALVDICRHSGTCSHLVEEKAKDYAGLKAALFMYCSCPDRTDAVFDVIENALDGTISLGDELPSLEGVELDWDGHKDLLLKVLRSKNRRLIEAVLPKGIPTEFANLGDVDFGDILELLDYVESEKPSIDNGFDWFCDQLASFIGCHGDLKTTHRLIAILADDGSKHRTTVSKKILPFCENVTLSDMPESALSYLLSEMREPNPHGCKGFLIAEVADEDFVQERLLPLLTDVEDLFQCNLREVLEHVGQRHGRRYLA
ncbi:MAG: SIR2 family protein [Hyphomicrobiales bacterium]